MTFHARPGEPFSPPDPALQAAMCRGDATVQDQRHESVLQACNLQQPASAAAAAGAALAAASQGAATAALGAVGAAAQATTNAIEQQRLFSVYVHAPPEYEGGRRAAAQHGACLAAWSAYNSQQTW